MMARDLHYLQTGSDVALPPSAAELKAADLIHRLREERPRLRLVRGDTDRIEVAPTAAPQPNSTASTAADAPRHRPATSLRSPARPPSAARPTSPSAPTITSPSDPRWVLALRTAESLQGPILGPERRDRLVKLGKLMGLTAFDANLVIAIVQDQARRGHAPALCPTAGESQLAMVPLPRSMDAKLDARTRRIGIITGVITLLVGIELILLKWLFS